MAERIALIYQGLTSHNAERYGQLRQNRTANRWLQRADRAVPNIGLLERLTDPSAYLEPEFASTANFAAATAVTHTLFDSTGAWQPSIVTGNSHGLIIAVNTARGYRSYEDGLCFSQERGRLMGTVPGGVVVLSSNAEIAEKILQQVREETPLREGQEVFPTHYNSPTQTVIGGSNELLSKVAEIAKVHGVKAHTGLVSPPSHTPLMEPILDDIGKLVAPIVIDPGIPLVANTDASVLESAEDIKEEFQQQLIEPVNWIKGIRTIFESGVKTFVVIAPGSDSGAKMIQQIVPSADILIVGPGSLYRPNGK